MGKCPFGANFIWANVQMSKLSRAKVVCATDYQPCNMKPKTLPLTKTALGKNVPVQSIGFTGNSLVLDFVGRLAF